MHYVKKQLAMKNRVGLFKTTCGNGLVNVTEAQTSRRPLMDHNTQPTDYSCKMRFIVCFSLAPPGLTTVCKTTDRAVRYS
jgi:hypothetical protein